MVFPQPCGGDSSRGALGVVLQRLDCEVHFHCFFGLAQLSLIVVGLALSICSAPGRWQAERLQLASSFHMVRGSEQALLRPAYTAYGIERW